MENQSKSELRKDLSFLTTSGEIFDPMVFLTSNEPLDDVYAVSSDNRRVIIHTVQRICVTNEATGGYSLSSILVGFDQISEPIDGLFENVKLARKLYDYWKKLYTSKGKTPPRYKSKIGEVIIYMMIDSDIEYQEIINDGVLEYFENNLGFKYKQ
ncbi:hypothetical protein F0M16_19415 [Vibrio cholerae]|uniref:Uncharacterized protein n=1 Tax=Vibrio cholerae TaxID=666 RepID=A0A5Q6PE93_VIBCL|nr:hypothetical protein [Vibrio cholerae]KAA1253111.1 hypothetical protein F0M16_19415 [Vibrio cholerae]